MDGWLIVVETERMGGGSLLREIYAVREQSPVQAQEIVHNAARTSDERVILWTAISSDFLDVFDVPQGGCRRVQALS
jgi:hypothetical protein